VHAEVQAPPTPATQGAGAIQHSVVIPFYNEEENVEELVSRLTAVMERIGGAFEVVCVDDGSRDGTADRLRALAARDGRVRFLRFARNYGQEAAVQAALLHTRGAWVIQMDGDLQNPPEEVAALLAKRDEGYELVWGIRQHRHDPAHKVVASKLMVKVMRRLMGIELPEDVTTFRVIKGEIARFIAGLPEKRKFFSALAVWSGARSASVPVAHDARTRGVTKYNLWKRIAHTFDLVVGFSTRPLSLIGAIGASIAALGIAFALFRIAQKLFGVPVEMGWTSLISAVIILGGLQLVALSVIGEYVARIFIQAQDRPLYRIAEDSGVGRDPPGPGPTATWSGAAQVSPGGVRQSGGAAATNIDE